jgi:hypothetical protein
VIARKLYVVAVLPLGLGLMAVVVAALPALSAPPQSRILPLDGTINPCGYGFQIDIAPRIPTQDDTISVTYSADWPDSCVPVHHSHLITGNVIILNAVHYFHPGQTCATVISPWQGDAGLGKLSCGFYRVDVRITGVLSPSTSTASPLALCGSKSFAVCDWVETYLPVVAR